MPFKGAAITAASRLNDYRDYIEDAMADSRRIAFYEQANIDDPLLPEPPPPLPPVWADERESSNATSD